MHPSHYWYLQSSDQSDEKSEQLPLWNDPSFVSCHPTFGVEQVIEAPTEEALRFVKIRFGNSGHDALLMISQSSDHMHHLIYFERASAVDGRPRRLELLLSPLYGPCRRIGSGQHWDSQQDHRLSEEDHIQWHDILKNAASLELSSQEKKVLNTAQDLLNRDSLFNNFF